MATPDAGEPSGNPGELAADKCGTCGETAGNWRHAPSVVFDGRPAHEFETPPDMMRRP